MSAHGARLRIDENSFIPLPEQIRRGVTDHIISGALQVGDRLATVRQLAHDLGLAAGTVAKAYQLLEADGLIQTGGRKGTFVAQAPRPTAHQQALLRAAAEQYLDTSRELGATAAVAIRVVSDLADAEAGVS